MALWAGIRLPAAICLLVAGCNTPAVRLRAQAPKTPVATAAREPAPAPTGLENPPAFVRDPGPQNSPQVRSISLDAALTVLHVQVPADRREQVEPLWNHLREDVLGSATALRLRKNGLRVGIGHAEWWEAVKATLDAVDGVRSRTLDPVRLPPDFPLALELDQRPREQTLFYIADDGILTGETWPHSRNVLRLSYVLNRLHPERVRLVVVPEVRQRLDGWRWVRGAAGLTQEPEYSGRAFPAAAFAADLEPGEFLLIAPSREADVYGIVGGVFLSGTPDADRYDTYVFLRADVNHVALRP